MQANFSSFNFRFLNNNVVKLLAALFMVIDHVGLLFYPFDPIYRILGRLSLPLFAYLLAEGCRYTKNKTKHFLTLFLLAVLCQVVYYFFDNGSLYMCILVTFSLSVVNIYALQLFKNLIFGNKHIVLKLLSPLPFALTVSLTYILNTYYEIDYGFWGCMLPVFPALFDFKNIPIGSPRLKSLLDNYLLKIIALGVGLLLLAPTCALGKIQYYSLFALPILLFYNEKKGKLKMKYFFYLFYPLHLALLEGVYIAYHLL